MDSLSVVLPAKNEEKRLTMTITDVHRFLARKNIKHEIIAVISPGEDNTLEIAKRLKHGVKELSVIPLKEDNGKGFAIKQGMKKVKNNWILLMNSDNSVSIVETEKMFPYAKDYQLIIGQRKKEESSSNKELSFKSRCGKVCKSIINAWKVHDSQCGFKLMSKKFANKVLKKSKVDGPSFETEVIAIAKEQHIQFKEIPVNWQNTKEEPLSSEEYGDSLKNFQKIKANVEKGGYKGA